MSENFEPQFITNSYNIQINIVYNTKDSDETDETNETNETNDTNDTNYYIIDNMKDILLEEFSNKDKYESFKQHYPNGKNLIYIVDDSFYLDKRIMDSISKNLTDNFPSYLSSREIQKNYYINNLTRIADDTTISQNDKDSLFQLIRQEFTKLISSAYASDTNRISAITNINGLVDDPFFSHPESGLGGKNFHEAMKTKYYDTIRLQNYPLKKILDKFYNINNNNSLVNKYKYEYFLKTETIRSILKFINQNSADEQRSQLNNNQTKEEIYNKYFKYVFPNKKDVLNLSDSDKDKILMFYNVFYIIKNIYLLDDTIINITHRTKKTTTKKYYISKVSLLDLKENNTHFKIEQNTVTIFIKATLKYIIENPTLQINYLIDDLENTEQNYLSQSNILQPKDISSNYSSYNKIYIHDKIKYKENTYIIDEVIKSPSIKKYIKNKEELFFNTKAIKLLDYFIKNKVKKNPQDDIIKSNIKYLLHSIFKLYNNKQFKKYYIADTYIQYIDSSKNYYSIKKSSKITETNPKYETISDILWQSTDALATTKAAITEVQAAMRVGAAAAAARILAATTAATARTTATAAIAARTARAAARAAAAAAAPAAAAAAAPARSRGQQAPVPVEEPVEVARAAQAASSARAAQSAAEAAELKAIQAAIRAEQAIIRARVVPGAVEPETATIRATAAGTTAARTAAAARTTAARTAAAARAAATAEAGAAAILIQNIARKKQLERAAARAAAAPAAAAAAPAPAAAAIAAARAAITAAKAALIVASTASAAAKITAEKAETEATKATAANTRAQATTQTIQVVAAQATQKIQALQAAQIAATCLRECFYETIKSSDARLLQDIYKINLVFRCYSDKNGNKPTFMRKLVAENCLSRAQNFDKVLTDVLYKPFNISENYLYNKLSNITKKNQSSVVIKNKDKDKDKAVPKQVIPNANINIQPIEADNGRLEQKLTNKYNNNRTRKNSIR